MVAAVSEAMDREPPPGRRRSRPALWTAIAVGVVALSLIGVLATRKSALDKLADSPLLGRPAPEVAGPSVTSGEAIRLDAFRGRWVAVNFFATWCVPCRREHPEFIKFSQRHLLQADASVLMVIYDDKVTSVRGFFQTNGGDWPIVPDPDGRVALDYGVRGVPETFLVNPNGVIVARVVGGVTADGLERLLFQAKARGA